MFDKFVSFVRFVKIYWSSLLLNIKVNLFVSNRSNGRFLVLGISFGGGNKGSTAILRAFSTIFGIIRAKRGELNSKHGLVFTSISQVANSSSIIKSKPKISNVYYLFFESINMHVDFIASDALFYIIIYHTIMLGYTDLKNLYSFYGYVLSRYFWKSANDILFPF